MKAHIEIHPHKYISKLVKIMMKKSWHVHLWQLKDTFDTKTRKDCEWGFQQNSFSFSLLCVRTQIEGSYNICTDYLEVVSGFSVQMLVWCRYRKGRVFWYCHWTSCVWERAESCILKPREKSFTISSINA